MLRERTYNFATLKEMRNSFQKANCDPLLVHEDCTTVFYHGPRARTSTSLVLCECLHDCNVDIVHALRNVCSDVHTCHIHHAIRVLDDERSLHTLVYALDACVDGDCDRDRDHVRVLLFYEHDGAPSDSKDTPQVLNVESMPSQRTEDETGLGLDCTA